MVETSQNAKSRRRLGRGLASLMSKPVPFTPAAVLPPSGSGGKASEEHEAGDLETGGLRFIDVARIAPNRYQPRKQIDPARLEALAASIRQSGVMQPILVRMPRGGGNYEIVAGERRWRAAQLAGLRTLPALLCELDDAGAAEWALVENLQREDLDPIERAEAFQALVVEFELTHSQIAERVGMDRSSVANTIRLNSLDEPTKSDIRAGRLTQGHAKALLSVADPNIRRTLALAAQRHGWNVRRLEREVESLAASPSSKPAGRTNAPGAHVAQLEERIARAVQIPARIRLAANRTSGQIVLTFRTLEQFESLLQRLERAGA